MNKSELIAELNNRSDVSRVMTPQLIETIGDIKHYEVVTLEVSNDIALKKTVNFYTVAEGEPEEVAYYYRQTPTSAVDLSDTVKEAIDDYMDTQSGVITYTIREYKKDEKVSIADVYSIVDSTSAKSESWIIYKDNGSPVTHRVIS
jgi:hypothetical protein